MIPHRLRDTFGFIVSRDPAQLRIASGIRNASGVLLVLLVGIATSHLLTALSIAIGAQVAGFAGLNGPIYKRLKTMVMATLGMGLATFLAGVVSDSWIAALVVALLGFTAGFLNSISIEAGLIGMWGTIAFTLFSGLPHGGIREAGMRGVFVICGGTLEALLMILVERVHSSRVEERAVGSVYQAIAHYARTPSRQADLNVASSLQTATTHLLGGVLRASYRHRLERLIDVAESVRIEVVALQGMFRTFQTVGTITSRPAECLQQQVVILADALTVVGKALDTGKYDLLETQMEHELFRMSEQDDTLRLHSDWKQLHECARRAAAETLNAMELVYSSGHRCVPENKDISRDHNPGSQDNSSHRRKDEQWTYGQRFAFGKAWNNIRANFTMRSLVFRHGIRLGVVLVVSVMLERILPYPRSYWLPLTALVVLRPEFATTFTRGVARAVGTLFGAVAASLVLYIPDSEHLLGALLVAVLLSTMYAVLNYNMALFSLILTAEVTVLLSFFQGAPAATTIRDRIIYTVCGALLAFIAYLVWPTWLHRNMPEAIANLVSAEANYVELVFALGSHFRRDELETCRKNTRMVRTNVVDLLRQAAREPRTARVRVNHDERSFETAAGLVTGLNRLADSLLALESHLASPAPVRSRDISRTVELGTTMPVVLRHHPDVRLFGQYVQACLLEIELRIRQSHLQSLSDMGPLEEMRSDTKKELNGMELPTSLKSIFIRMEDNLGTIFRMLST